MHLPHLVHSCAVTSSGDGSSELVTKQSTLEKEASYPPSPIMHFPLCCNSRSTPLVLEFQSRILEHLQSKPFSAQGEWGHLYASLHSLV